MDEEGKEGQFQSRNERQIRLYGVESVAITNGQEWVIVYQRSIVRQQFDQHPAACEASLYSKRKQEADVLLRNSRSYCTRRTVEQQNRTAENAASGIVMVTLT